MIVRVDKCVVFAMKKINQTYSQYQPMILLDGKQIPAVEQCKDFVYLGKSFNFEMNLESAKNKLFEKLSELLQITSKLLVNPCLKIKILKQIIFPKISFELKIYDFNHTWLDSKVD